MWNEEPGRAPMLRLETRPVEAKSDPRLSVEKILQGQIDRVVAEGVDECVGSVRLAYEERIEQNALPGRSELRPTHHAVQIDGKGLARQTAKRPPVPLPELVVSLLDGELPFLEWHPLRGPRGENGESGGEVPPGRELALSRVTSF